MPHYEVFFSSDYFFSNALFSLFQHSKLILLDCFSLTIHGELNILLRFNNCRFLSDDFASKIHLRPLVTSADGSVVVGSFFFIVVPM